MKKVALLVAFILALTPLAFAQGTVKAQRPDTVEVILSGEVDVPGYYRSEEINCVLNRGGVQGWGVAVGAGGVPVLNPNGQADVDDELSDAAYCPLVVINLDAQMGKKVFAHVTLKTNRLADNIWGVREDGLNANAHSVVGFQDIDLPVKAAYVEIQEFLFEETTFKFGLQNLCYDLRGKGAFFIDLANSEFAWMTPVTEAWLTGSWYGPINPGGAEGLGLARFNSNPGGFIVNYTTKDEVFSMDFYGMTIMETLNGHFDEQLYGIEFAYIFPGSKEEKNKSYLSGIVNCMQADQGNNKVWTIGLGIDYFWQNFEFYGELYGQFGTWWNDENFADTNVTWADADEDTVKQSAWAFYIGGKYTFNESTAKPWIDLSVWYIGGDDGDIGDDSPTNKDFLSYENNNATMIIEDSLLGLDIDSNYWKIMLDLGASFKLHEENDFVINLTWAWFQLIDEPNRVGLPEPTAATVAGNDTWNIDDDLGHEIDLKFSWAYSKQCTFALNFGFLFSGDFFAGDPDDADAGAGDTFDGGYCIDDDSMFMCIFDTNVKW
jgi:hypothetical protein